MRILFLVSSLESGGAERVATTLCNAWVARGDSVTLVPTFWGGGTSFYPLHDGVDLLYLSQLLSESSSLGKRHIARLTALRQLIREKCPDVVVSFLPNVNIAALAATAFSDVPCIVCERSDPAVQPIGWTWRVACNLLYRYADLVSVQTQAVASNIHQVYGGLKKVAAIPNPLPTDLLAWQASGSDNDQKTLISVGRLSEEKRVSLVIDAFCGLAPAYPDWDLHVYGDGPQRTALQYQIEKLGLSERVFLKGRTTEPWRAMATADAFVMASRYEGFPNALLEAMGVGLPCVTTDCPSGPREISREGKDALLIGVEDRGGLRNALARLMSDRSLRQTLGKSARASVVERYALEAVLKDWDELFASVGAIV